MAVSGIVLLTIVLLTRHTWLSSQSQTPCPRYSPAVMASIGRERDHRFQQTPATACVSNWHDPVMDYLLDYHGVDKTLGVAVSSLPPTMCPGHT